MNIKPTKTKTCPANRRVKTKNNPTTLRSYERAGLYNSFNRALCILALFLMAIVFVPYGNQPVHAESQADVDNLTAQISALTIQLNEKKAVAKTFADEVAIYDGKIQQVQLQIQATQAQINVHNSQITDINGQIATNEMDLRVRKESLKEQLRVLYENSNTSTLELVAGSNSFSDFVDQTEYLQTMQIKTRDTIGKIKSLKQQLEDNKNNVEKRKQEIASLQQTQLNQKAELDKERYGKQMLLNQANSQSKQAQNSIEAKQEQKRKLIEFLENPPVPPAPATPTTTEPTDDGSVPVTNGQVPSLMQTSPSWSEVAINDSNRPPGYDPSTIGAFGCGITSLAMIFQSYGYNVSPADIAYNPGYFSTGWGWDLLYWGGIYSATGGRFNVQPEYGSIGKANQWAAAGKPFMVWVDLYSHGIYYGKHYVVITGQQNGSWVMNDPLYQGSRIFNYSGISQYVFVN